MRYFTPMKAKVIAFRRHCEIMDFVSAFVIAFFGTVGNVAKETIDKSLPKL